MGFGERRISERIKRRGWSYQKHTWPTCLCRGFWFSEQQQLPLIEHLLCKWIISQIIPFSHLILFTVLWNINTITIDKKIALLHFKSHRKWQASIWTQIWSQVPNSKSMWTSLLYREKWDATGNSWSTSVFHKGTSRTPIPPLNEVGERLNRW